MKINVQDSFNFPLEFKVGEDTAILNFDKPFVGKVCFRVKRIGKRVFLEVHADGVEYC